MSNFANYLIGGRFRLGPLIGSGSFGQIYLITQQSTGQIYALKKQDDKIKHPQLVNQHKVIKLMTQFIGFPKIQWFGNQNRSNMIVMELLGPSIQDLYGACGKRFSLKTVLMLVDQMIQKMQILHSKNFIHRDIKPQNFLMGIGKNSHVLYCIDFGLSKKYRDIKTHQHIPYKENRTLTGTARYSSINSHIGIEQSRRDDLQAIGYVMIYLINGGLPWQGIRANNKIQKYEKIMQKKMSIPVQILCKGLPIQFSIYMNYCRTLNFQQKPDYNYLRRMFRDLFERVGFQLDFQYDWCQLQSNTEYVTNKLTIELLKKNQQIPSFQLNQNKNNGKVQFNDCVQPEDIEIDLISGNQNVPEDLFDQSDGNLIKNYNKKSVNEGFLEKKNILWD